jgi:hypothetical protein
VKPVPADQKEENSMTVFDMLKMIQIDHQPLTAPVVVMTDVTGKPNAVLTDLLHDVLNKMELFVNLADSPDAEAVIEDLHNSTPLRDDVLDEYHKILDQPVSGLNIARRKQLVEIIYDEFV